MCPEHGIEMRLIREGKFGPFWSCPEYPNCDYLIGAHKQGFDPLGVPTNKEGRLWRVKAHDEFDALWKNGGVTRGQAYRWLTKKMGLGRPAHIGEMDIPQCRKVIGLVKLTPPKIFGEQAKEQETHDEAIRNTGNQ